MMRNNDEDDYGFSAELSTTDANQIRFANQIRLEWDLRHANSRRERNFERAAENAFRGYFTWEDVGRWQAAYGVLPFSAYWKASAEEKAAIKQNLGIVAPAVPEMTELVKMISVDPLNASEAELKDWQLAQDAHRHAFKYSYFDRESLREDLILQEELRFLDEYDFVNENFDKLYPDYVYRECDEETGGELNFYSLIEDRLGYYERTIRFDELKPAAQLRYINNWNKAIEKLKEEREQQSEQIEHEQSVSREISAEKTEVEMEDSRAVSLEGVLKQMVTMHGALKERFSQSTLSDYERLLERISEEIEKRGYRMERFSDLEEYDDFQKFVRKEDAHRLIFGDSASDPGGHNRLQENSESMVEQFNRVFGLENSFADWSQCGWKFPEERQSEDLVVEERRAMELDARERKWDERGGDGRVR